MIRLVVLIFCISFTQFFVSAQTDIKPEFQKKIAMIRAIEKYAQTELKLKLKPDFYTQWEQVDAMTRYLYISRKDTIQSPKEISSYIFFGTDSLKADSAQKAWEAKGYQTILYQTAGNSACHLSTRFLSYPPHAIAFICFHELFHRHRQAKKSKLPYSYEEATCDWLGNKAAISFLQSFAPEYVDSAMEQAEVNKTLYHYILDYCATLNQSSTDKMTQPLLEPISNIQKRYNLFQQDRFNYPMNNAFLLRTLFYAKYYFDIESLGQVMNNTSETIKFVTKQKGSAAQVQQAIQKKVQSLSNIKKN